MIGRAVCGVRNYGSAHLSCMRASGHLGFGGEMCFWGGRLTVDRILEDRELAYSPLLCLLILICDMSASDGFEQRGRVVTGDLDRFCFGFEGLLQMSKRGGGSGYVQYTASKPVGNLPWLPPLVV